MRIGLQCGTHGAIGAPVASYSVRIGMTTINKKIAEGLRLAATTLHVEDEAFPAPVEAQPYPSIGGAKEDRNGPGQPVNPDMIEAEVTEKREGLLRISHKFVFHHMGPRTALTDPGGHKRPCAENRDDRYADHQ